MLTSVYWMDCVQTVVDRSCVRIARVLVYVGMRVSAAKGDCRSNEKHCASVRCCCRYWVEYLVSRSCPSHCSPPDANGACAGVDCSSMDMVRDCALCRGLMFACSISSSDSRCPLILLSQDAADLGDLVDAGDDGTTVVLLLSARSLASRRCRNESSGSATT